MIKTPYFLLQSWPRPLPSTQAQLSRQCLFNQLFLCHSSARLCPPCRVKEKPAAPHPLSDPRLTVNSHLQINYLALERIERKRRRRKKRQQSNKTSSDRRSQYRWAMDKDVFFSFGKWGHPLLYRNLLFIKITQFQFQSSSGQKVRKIEPGQTV